MFATLLSVHRVHVCLHCTRQDGVENHGKVYYSARVTWRYAHMHITLECLQ